LPIGIPITIAAAFGAAGLLGFAIRLSFHFLKETRHFKARPDCWVFAVFPQRFV
jgi:hypothetical protein